MSWLWLLKLGVPVLLALAAYGYGSTFVTDYKENIRTIERQAGIIKTLEARELSYKSRIDIRDQAIANSRCAKQIQGWVMKPSTLPSPIPKPFSIPGQN
jgi:hypothetical protein